MQRDKRKARLMLKHRDEPLPINRESLEPNAANGQERLSKIARLCLFHPDSFLSPFFTLWRNENGTSRGFQPAIPAAT